MATTMSSGRVIQDSDDESDDAGSPPPIEHESLDLSLESIIHLPSSSPPKILAQSGQPSTSSTERLDRELKAAHQRLLEPTQDSYPSTIRSRHSSQQPSDSPKEIRESKRRATATDLVPKAKKQKKYGRATQDSGDFYGNSEDELGERSAHKALVQDDLGRGEIQSNESCLADSATASRVDAMLHSYSGVGNSIYGSGRIGNLFSIETSVQKALLPPTPRTRTGIQSQRSEPNTWPTIPNTTPAKSTPIEQLGRNSSSVDDCHFKESVDSVDSVGQAANESGSRNGYQGTVPAADNHTDEANIQDELSISLPSTSAHQVSNTTQKHDSDRSSAADELGLDDPGIGLPKEQYQPRPSRSRGNHGDDLVIPEDFSKRPEAIIKGKRKMKSRRKTTALEKPSPKVEIEIEDEDEASIKVPVIAIPKLSPSFKTNETIYNGESEQENDAGKAREWRGETQIKTQPAAADPSPEKRGRGRPKKQVVKPIEDPQEPDSAAQGELDDDEGLTDATPSSKALAMQRGGKMLKPISPILEDENDESSPSDEDPIAPRGREKRKAVPTDDEHDTDLPDVPELTTSISKQKGRKKRKTGTETAPADADRNDDMAGTNQPVDEVQPKQRGRKKKQKAPTEIAPIGDSNAADGLTGAIEPNSKAPPKKRGRKKREPDAPPAPIILSDHEDSDQPAEREDEGPPKALSQSPNKSNATATKPPPAPSAQKLTTPPTTPAKEGAKPTHSPITSSKVRFRVGLSKKARIAPLLRIVRK